MKKQFKSIPLRALSPDFDKGIAVGKLLTDLSLKEEDALHSHRHDYHFFVLQVSGHSHFEIDFHQYKTDNAAVIYIAPDQVHKALKAGQVECYFIAIHSVHIKEEYIGHLQEIAPTFPIALNNTDLQMIQQAIMLCSKLFEDKHRRLYDSMLKDSCNTFIALTLSLYLAHQPPSAPNSQYADKTKKFKQLLEQNYRTLKRPAEYADKMNISVPYLNECISAVTGHSVTFHIQGRIILEAKRLLYHTRKSVKEIAELLGYEDYAYFCRIFNKATGMPALAFRRKNCD
ncbi:helix-turn-helix domain-containing protein [Polluticaenibacter yanchengensis]|uniref:Helix-turn-helix domain-containing protein n=1 Tax=Polluticaenibacter yanchengensis TaxID=3014562 RepID=A0ABT4UKA5_9BACT|nr:helix-turn-helix domain-containing protein [Chitinophagaceae bacterium LY-5]